MVDLRYPIGQFAYEGDISSLQREAWIKDIRELPERLQAAIQGLTEAELDLPYREGGWTVRQVVHHVADSHMNAYTRFKLALTEENPTIKPYFEDRWANLQDSLSGDIHISLLLLKSLHERWVIVLESIQDDDYKRQFYHPGSKETVGLDYCLGTYAWHGQHHTAHITSLRDRLEI